MQSFILKIMLFQLSNSTSLRNALHVAPSPLQTPLLLGKFTAYTTNRGSIFGLVTLWTIVNFLLLSTGVRIGQYVPLQTIMKMFTIVYRGMYWAIRTPVDNSKNFYYCLQGYVLGNTYPCRGFLASPKEYILPTHIAHLGRLDGFNLPSNNVNTMSLARTYPGIPSSRLEGQYHPHPSALK